ITAVLNSCRDVDVPFVFGGDGGAIVVPASHAAAASDALRALMTHAHAVYGLGLRAAAVPVSRIRAEGSDLHVRRMALNKANHLAMFSGGGIDHVDAIMKQGGEGDPCVLSAAPEDAVPDLEGLSCRWQPLQASYGAMIALMVRPTDPENGTAYGQIVARLQEILEEDIPAHAPASDKTLRMRWPQAGLGMELRGLALGMGRVKAMTWAVMTSVFQRWAHFRGIRVGTYDAPAYTEELKAQTDFRKFDGCLRTVLDCTAQQVAAIETWLDAEFEAGRLVYGLHVDTQALMTCLVFNLEQSRHVHFVDAAGGGFAEAAKGFKARLSQQVQTG
ncbi:MAG: DUF3095 family protein, partial [Paracoccaceae bacterium]